MYTSEFENKCISFRNSTSSILEFEDKYIYFENLVQVQF